MGRFVGKHGTDRARQGTGSKSERASILRDGIAEKEEIRTRRQSRPDDERKRRRHELKRKSVTMGRSRRGRKSND